MCRGHSEWRFEPRVSPTPLPSAPVTCTPAKPGVTIARGHRCQGSQVAQPEQCGSCSWVRTEKSPRAGLGREGRGVLFCLLGAVSHW